MVGLDSLVRDRPSNAALAWALVAVLVGTAVERLLAADLYWAGFAALVIAVALVPVVVRDERVTVSWPVLALAALPALARVVGVFRPPLGYLAVAALGLLVVAEVDRFTTAQMPGWFAAAMVVMATMTAASLWTTVRYAANYLAATPIPPVDALMWDLVIATGVGLGFGLLFELTLRVEEGG